MEKSSKRGKIPQHDWPSIIKRYEAGETLASIARTYDCSPPAISYIVSRSRAREATAEGSAVEPDGPSEPQLVKGRVGEATSSEDAVDAPENGKVGPADSSSETSSSVEGMPIAAQHTVRNDPRPDPDASGGVVPGAEGTINRGGAHTPRERNSQLASASGRHENGESRRTLHLSLPQDAAHRSDVQRQHPPLGPHASAPGTISINRSAGSQYGSLQPNRGGAVDQIPPINGGSPPIITEPHRAKDADAFIDQALRDRVDSDITAFLAAFDAALAADTPESRAELRDATDRLLRAGARTRIQLERLEARVPMPPRDGHTSTAWRAR
jgi:hypothetical protein